MYVITNLLNTIPKISLSKSITFPNFIKIKHLKLIIDIHNGIKISRPKNIQYSSEE